MPGHSCSKLLMSIVNLSVKFQIYFMQKKNLPFCAKNVQHFCSAKVSYIFSSKNMSTINCAYTRRLNESLTNVSLANDALINWALDYVLRHKAIFYS